MLLSLPPDFKNPDKFAITCDADPFFPRDVWVAIRTRPLIGHDAGKVYVHSHYHVLWVCIEGCGELEVDGLAYRFTPGTAMLVFPGQTHLRIHHDLSAIRWMLIRFTVDKTPLWLRQLKNVTIRINPETSGEFERFAAAVVKNQNTSGAAAATETLLRLGLLLNYLHMSRIAQTPFAGMLDSADGQVRNVCSEIITGSQNNDKYKDIAKRHKMSQGHLRRIFKAQTGYTPFQLKQRARIFQAQHFLMNTDLSISEIAEKTGFASVYAFSRFFSNWEGISPSEFRKKR